MSPRRVFVRGAGARTALGRTWPESVAALAAGASAVGPIEGFDARGFPCAVAAPVPGATEGATEGDRRLAFALPAAREAWAAAGLTVPPGRLGVFVGAESGRVTFATLVALARAAGGGDTFDHASFLREGPALAAHLAPARLSPASVTSALAAALGARGPVATVSLACASGAAAIAEAARAVRLGECDVALAGGVGADVDALLLAAFGLLGALSARGVSCPFDARRDGFVLGEGAAMVVLSSERGAAIAEIAGTGGSLDAHHLTAPHPGGEGAVRAMTAALRAGGAFTLGGAPSPPVDYVQAHGTSTVANDAVEAAALRRVLGADLERARVSSVKGALGHAIAGAGALGFLCALEAVEHGLVLPTAGLREPDRGCELPHVLGSAETRVVRGALVNAFAFGGANVSLFLRRAA